MMKLSEAIRLGAAMKPQGTGYLLADGRTCAMGAAYEAIGLNLSNMMSTHVPTRTKEITRIPDQWLIFTRSFRGLKCPSCGDTPDKESMTGLGAVIVHLNDTHVLTREKIADFVELLELEHELNNSIVTVEQQRSTMKSPYQRKDEAEARQKMYSLLSLDAKIKLCKGRRGKSHRELAKLLAQKTSNDKP